MANDTEQTTRSTERSSNNPPSAKTQWATVIALIAISEVIFFAGYTSISIAIDVLAVAVFAGFHRARKRHGGNGDDGRVV